MPARDATRRGVPAAAAVRPDTAGVPHLAIPDDVVGELTPLFQEVVHDVVALLLRRAGGVHTPGGSNDEVHRVPGVSVRAVAWIGGAVDVELTLYIAAQFVGARIPLASGREPGPPVLHVRVGMRPA